MVATLIGLKIYAIFDRAMRGQVMVVTKSFGEFRGKVNGIGGVFFRAKDPAALAEWYRDMLGIKFAPSGMDMPSGVSEGRVTVFAPFVAGTACFPQEYQMLINFRLSNLDAMLAQLRAASV